jgi:U3 small nucleolar RNA-associated protein 13
VWDTRRGHCTHVFRGHEAPVLAAAFHPVPGRLLLFTASEDTTARVWSLSGSACLAALKCHVSAVTSLGVIPAGLGPHGDALVLGGRDKVVSVWAIPQGASAAGAAMADKPVATVLVYEAVEAVLALPPPGSAASAASLAKKAGRGDAAGGAKGSSTSLEGVMFMTAGDKGIVRTWTAAGGGKCVASAPADAVCSGPEAGFMALALVPRARPAPPGHHQVMATTTDGRVMFYSSSSEAGRTSSAASVDTWRLSWQLLGNLDEVIDVRCISAPGSSAAATTPAPPACIVAVTNSAVVRVLDGTTLGCVASLEGHSDTVLCADVAAWPINTGDAHTGVTACIVTGGKDRCLRLWRLVGPNSGAATAAAAWEVACLGAGEGHAGAVTAVACGTRTAGLVVTGGADKLLKLWDCSPSLATSSQGDTAVPFRVRGAVVAHDKEVNAVAVAPNEQLVATASADRTLKLWRLPTLVLHRTLRGHTRGVWSCAFSPVDAVLVSGSADKSVRVWSCTDGACLKALQGHASGVLRALWLTHGTQVASAGVDGCLKLWNVAAGECVWTGEGHDSKAWALAATTDGTSLVSGGADGTLALWADATSADAEARAAATEAAALADQQLATAMAGNAFAPAFRLALQLARPGALYTLLSRHFSGLSARDEGRSAALVAALQATPVEGLARFLAVCTEWNANSKTCHVAQTSLACLFAALPPGDVAKLPGARDLLPGFAAYTKRHSARLDRLVRATYVLDFTLTQQGVLLEEEEDGEGDDVAAAAAAAAAAGADAWEGDAAAWGVPVPVPRAGARGEASRALVPRHMGGDDDDFTINVGGAEVDDEDELPGWGGGGDDGVEEEDPQPEEPPPRASSRATRGGAADDTFQDVDAGTARRSTRVKRGGGEPEANGTAKKGAKKRKG